MRETNPDTSTGWIKLYRKSMDNHLYFAEPFTKFHAWLDILMLANHKKTTISIRGILITIERGQVLAADDFLASRWKWSRGKVRRFMSHLASKAVQQIVQQKNNVCSIITVRNYHAYQSGGTADGTASSTADGQQTDSRRYTLKNVENEKNDKKQPPNPQGGTGGGEKGKPKKNPYGEFGRVKLTDEEHAKLMNKQGEERLNKGIGLLDDYMQSKGKTYKDHYAVLKETSWVWKRLDEDRGIIKKAPTRAERGLV